MAEAPAYALAALRATCLRPGCGGKLTPLKDLTPDGVTKELLRFHCLVCHEEVAAVKNQLIGWVPERCFDLEMCNSDAFEEVVKRAGAKRKARR